MSTYTEAELKKQEEVRAKYRKVSRDFFNTDMRSIDYEVNLLHVKGYDMQKVRLNTINFYKKIHTDIKSYWLTTLPTIYLTNHSVNFTGGFKSKGHVNYTLIYISTDNLPYIIQCKTPQLPLTNFSKHLMGYLEKEIYALLVRFNLLKINIYDLSASNQKMVNEIYPHVLLEMLANRKVILYEITLHPTANTEIEFRYLSNNYHCHSCIEEIENRNSKFITFENNSEFKNVIERYTRIVSTYNKED